MPARQWDIAVEAGSWEPSYITVSNPDSGAPLDLTEPGYAVRGTVATRQDGGTVLAQLPDTTVLRRTAEGRVYFEPLPATTSTWTWRLGFHQIELTHPSGKTVRIAQGVITVSPEFVTP